jgi:probable F420-dependent oxidoreductase
VTGRERVTEVPARAHGPSTAPARCYRRRMIPRRPGRPLGVGVQLPEVEREVRWPELRAIARTVEQAGFDSIWFGDHLLYRYASGETRGPWEAWTTLAGLAEATERVALGPLVAATAFHAPFMLAKQAATVDEISGGRLVLGLGAGWNPVEFAALGAPFGHRISRFEESFTIVRELLAHGSIDFEGAFFTARDAELLPRPARPGGPPILIGSSGPRMLAATVPYVAAWNAWYADTQNSPDGVAALREVVDAACVEAGRDPAEVERTVAVLVQMPEGTGRVMGDTSEKMAVTPLKGDAGHMADELRAYARAGIGHVQLVIDPITEASVAALAPVLELLDRG